MCLHPCLPASLPACLLACIPAWSPACILACLPASLLACTPACPGRACAAPRPALDLGVCASGWSFADPFPGRGTAPAGQGSGAGSSLGIQGARLGWSLAGTPSLPRVPPPALGAAREPRLPSTGRKPGLARSQMNPAARTGLRKSHRLPPLPRRRLGDAHWWPRCRGWWVRPRAGGVVTDRPELPLRFPCCARRWPPQPEEMSAGRHRWSLGSLLLLLVFHCSLGPGGAPRNCSASCFPRLTYRGRAELFAENGSLLLRHLKLSDSGVYSVTFGPSFQTRHISLAVHEQCFPPERLDPANTEEPEHVYYWAIGICSSVALLLLFLLFCCLRRRGAAQQKKRRITKQQVSSVEEPHMGSTAARDMATIYARIGDRFEEPQPRPPSEVVYTSITEPGPPALDTGLYHLLV
ncbi:trimethyllysine dioxygenase, mitochondrial isoform X2 [Rissa tridactyla]|uniref:trimethyllysine dioxygenase, mitochondrial isoform X2 n=1 Tax=Rissa tridactyla TaxID=75485 RepID=UPI0023BABCE0|nr:trimethyllysine dioxygenase, mitochondrial isoform X2 [Rissa tridactyla]